MVVGRLIVNLKTIFIKLRPYIYFGLLGSRHCVTIHLKEITLSHVPLESGTQKDRVERV